MPRAPWETDDNLAIEVQDFQCRYKPGDIIEGRVTRRNRSDYRSCTVRLIFFGRVKTSFRHGGDNHSQRASVIFFETIYPLHNSISSGEISTSLNHSWPFRITVPEHPVPRDRGRPDKSDKLPPEKGYLSNEGDISAHSLPGTFACPDKLGYDQFVEYYLKAELRLDGEGGLPGTSILPINLQPRGTALPIPSFKSRVFRQTLEAVKSPKCLPENASRELSFSEKLKSKVSGRTPQYVFRITTIAPTLLQLRHPEVFPLKVYITPRYGKKFSNFGEGDPYNMPPTMFKSLKLKLIAKARYRGPGSWNSTEEDSTTEYRFTLPDNQPNVPVPILMPEELPSFEAATGQDADQNLPPWSTVRKSHEPPKFDESKALDLGQMFQLKPHRVHPSDPSPTFMSYNLSLDYILEYKMDMRTVDVDHRAEGLVPVVVLAPSEETQDEMRSTQGKGTVRHDDIKEWARRTGANVRQPNAPMLLERLFGSPGE